ncbi:MAG: fibronectin type III domain-containing protein [Syntrophales bacterium]
MITKRSSGMLVTIGILAVILFNGCGAGTSGDVPAPEPGQTTAASIDLLVSNPQIDSDMTGAPSVALTAIVKDSGNRALADKDVSFSADSGIVAVTSGKTDATGKALAALGTGGNPANRVIHLSAATGSVSTSNSVTVTGTNLSISGAQSLSFGDTTPLTIFLKDSAGVGISGKQVTVTSAAGNTLTASTYMTSLSGQVTVNVVGTVGGADTITASAIGATVQHSLTVNTAILKFLDPPPAVITEIDIETNRTVTVQYTSGTTAQAGVTVNFSTTRGGFMPGNQIVAVAVTGADGRASVTVRSTNSGPGLLQASVANGPTAQTAVEFVAPTVYSLTLQASPTVIGTNSLGLEGEKSLITATVRDGNNNLVKRQNIIFNIVNDVSGGRLTPASAITDSFGAASTYFIAGASSGGLGGVTIRATVQGTAITTTTTITVAKKSLFIALATGNEIKALAPNKYLKEYSALVTDSAGNPVVGATVVSTVTPNHYRKGYYVWSDEASQWIMIPTLQALTSTLPGVPACANEDGMLHNPLYDFNGILDTNPSTGEKEDQNGNNRLDPGNVASTTAVVTDATGHATVSIVYAEDYCNWVNVKLEAFANDLKGSTASAYAIFDLPCLSSDFANKIASPPGNPSPFGTSTSCYVDLTVVPISSSQMSLTWQKSVTASSYRLYRNGINIANTAQNSYFDQGLSHGTLYCYQVRTVDAGGTETSFTGTVCNATTVMAPSGLTATAISPSQIRLTWSALAGSTGYRVYRDNNDGLGLALRASVVTTSFIDSGLRANTLYCYAVAGNNAAGVESPKSAQVCATTQLSAPATPLNLTARGSAGPPPSVTLAWNASSGAALYRIYRDGGTDTGGPSLSIAAPAVTAPDTGIDIGGLIAKTGYCYTITAVDVSGNESAQSTPVCTSTGGVLPPAPTGLTATLLPGPQVRLNWTASAGAVGYQVYRNGEATLIAGTTTTIIDITVAASTGYCYTVAALDSTGSESAKSAQVCVVTGTAAPPTPTGLAATLLAGPQIQLNWNASTGAASYRVYRNGGTIPLLTPTATTVLDSTVVPSTTYCYTVSAVNNSGDESAQSPSVCITTIAAPPGTPTILNATAISPAQITVTWTAVTGSTGYRLYRDGATAPLASVVTTSYTDGGLTANTVYCYAVSSINGAGAESAKSAQVCATTQPATVPSTPTALSAVGGLDPAQVGPPAVAASVKVTLSWTPPSVVGTQRPLAVYKLYRRTGTETAAVVLSVPASVTGLVDKTNLQALTTYCYSITALDVDGRESLPSTQVCTATPVIP